MIPFEIHKRHLEKIVKFYKHVFEIDLLDKSNEGNQFYEDFKFCIENKENEEIYLYFITRNLWHPIECMLRIKEHDNQQYENLKSRLRKYKNNLSFHGDKFELIISYSLLSKGCKYIKSESPDFKILFENEEIYIECTSAYFENNSKPTKLKMLKKLKRTIIGKLSEPYARLNTALFIDITNLNYHASEINESFSKEELDYTVNNAIKKTNMQETYGSIILFSNYSTIIQNDRSFNWSTANFHNKNVKTSLKNFLNSIMKEHVVYSYIERPITN